VITAVDTNVLLDVFGADKTFGPRSRDALREAIDGGGVIACDVVWAELAASFPSTMRFEDAMRRVGVAFDAIDAVAAVLAGEAWRAFMHRGRRRGRVAADFLVGAHAFTRSDRLLTRDRGFYRAHFRKLTIVDPSRA
jgi:predicted nucleic acid-binding protein